MRLGIELDHRPHRDEPVQADPCARLHTGDERGAEATEHAQLRGGRGLPGVRQRDPTRGPATGPDEGTNRRPGAPQPGRGRTRLQPGDLRRDRVPPGIVGGEPDEHVAGVPTIRVLIVDDVDVHDPLCAASGILDDDADLTISTERRELGGRVLDLLRGAVTVPGLERERTRRAQGPGASERTMCLRALLAPELVPGLPVPPLKAVEVPAVRGDRGEDESPRTIDQRDRVDHPVPPSLNVQEMRRTHPSTCRRTELRQPRGLRQEGTP
ncbi:Uncharacterised protein [Streptococcus pyogenes]|nr:Uncharacterised protein [Streptococcus pyogenes]